MLAASPSPSRPLPHMLAAPPSPSRPLPHIRAQMQTTPRELSRRDLLQVGPEPAVLGVERVERLVSEAFALQTPGRHGHAVVAGQHVRAHRPRTTSLKRFPFTLAKGASVSYSSSGVSYSSSVNRMTADALAFRRRPRPPAGVLALPQASSPSAGILAFRRRSHPPQASSPSVGIFAFRRRPRPPASRWSTLRDV